jgi:hypothetical protein
VSSVPLVVKAESVIEISRPHVQVTFCSSSAAQHMTKHNLTPLEHMTKHNLTPLEHMTKHNLTPLEHMTKHVLTPLEHMTKRVLTPLCRSPKHILSRQSSIQRKRKLFPFPTLSAR